MATSGRMNFARKTILVLIVACALPASASPLLLAQDPADKKKQEKEKADAEHEATTDQLPLLEDLPLPETEKLLEGEVQDWIVLIGGRVLKVPALQPRPNHLEWLLEQQKKMSARRPNDPALLQDWLTKYKSYNYISIEFPDQGVEEDYNLHVRYVDYILYHEDLALKKAKQLIKAGNAVDAQRLISAVGRWNFQNNVRRKKEKLAPIPWANLLDRQRDLLLLNVSQARSAGHWERAFHLEKIHWGHDAQFKQLSSLLGEAFHQIAEQAIQKKDYRKIRFFLRQLQALYPAHEEIKDWQDRLIALSQSQKQLGTKAFQEKNYREASQRAQQSINIWPFNTQSHRQIQALQERYQILRTGQIAHDDQNQLQQQSLLEHPWFEIEKITEGYPRYRSRFIESWVPADLGLTIRLKLKLNRLSYESRPILGSYQLAEQLAAESLQCPQENRKLFANSIEAIHVVSPDQLSVRFTTQTAHPLGLLSGLLDTESSSETAMEHPFFHRRTMIDGEETKETGPIYIRAFPEPDTATHFGVAEVQERTFSDREELLRALLRDELDYVPDFPLAYVRRLKQDKRFSVLKYHTPSVTLIQFHFHGILAQEPALRLAFFSALDRKKMMEQIIQAQQAEPQALRLTDSIAPSTSHAQNQTDQNVKFDRTAARALYTILSRSQKKRLELRLLVSQDAQALQLAALLKTQWEALGITVRFISKETLPENDPDLKNKPPGTTTPAHSTEARWDAAIVTHQMLSPQHELPRLLSASHQLTETELHTLPLPVQRSLLKLEASHNWEEVNQALRELQDNLAIDAWMLPLWEQKRYQAVRREIRGVPSSVMRPYQNLDRWVVTPTIPAY